MRQTNKILFYTNWYYKIKDDNVFRDNKNKSYTIIETRKDGIKFQNAKLERINEEYVSILEKYESEQKSVIDEMIKITGTIKLYA